MVVPAAPEPEASVDDPAGIDEAGAEETIARAEVEPLAKLDARLETAESGTTGIMLVLTLGIEDLDTTEAAVVVAPVLGPAYDGAEVCDAGAIIEVVYDMLPE